MLLATLSDNVVVSKQTGKVRDKDRTWDSVKKSLLGNINGFLEELKVSVPKKVNNLYSHGCGLFFDVLLIITEV